DFHRFQAGLDCAVVALATERYRHDHRRWPEDLGLLLPGYLSEIPLDPFSGDPLRYRQLTDRVEIFSLGPDHKNPKTFDLTGREPGAGIGFRLWNVDARVR